MHGWTDSWKSVCVLALLNFLVPGPSNHNDDPSQTL